MQTFADLRRHADACLYAMQHEEALHAYQQLLQLQPTQIDVRLRLADALLALGEVAAAKPVYASVVRFAAQGGYPFRALVAAEILRALSDKFSGLGAQIAELYAADSPRLGQGARISLGMEDEPLPENFALGDMPERTALVAAASAAGTSLQAVEAFLPANLPALPLFSELSTSVLKAMFACVRLLRARTEQTVFRQDSAAEAFFVLARGAIKVSQHRAATLEEEIEIARLYSGAIFGEMALVRGTRRQATVVCLEDSDLLCFDAEALRAAQQEMPTIAEALERFARQRALQNLLTTSPLFRFFDAAQQQSLLKRFEVFDVEAGTQILRQDDAGTGLYLLWHGDVRVSKKESGREVQLATLHAGDLFGEISMLDDRPVTASVSAITPCSLLFLPRTAFLKLIAAFPPLREFAERLKEDRLIDTCLVLDDGFSP